MTSKMSYPKIIQWRIRSLWLALIAMLIFMVVIGEIGAHSSRVVTGFAYSGGSLLYWAGLIYIIARIVINKKLLKDRLRLKAQQLRERDEGIRHLHQMSGGWVMDVMLVMAYIAAVAASCWSNEAFYAAFGLLVVAALLKGGAYLAYDKGWMKA